MSEHREGTLFYDTETGRYDIRFDLESFYGGLHCGECFDVKVKNVWVPVRIEMGDDWYLVGLNVSRLDGLRQQVVKPRLRVCPVVTSRRLSLEDGF